MGDAERFVALQQKGVELVAQAQAIRAQGSAQNRALTEAETRQIQELGREAQSTARSIAGIGQTGPDAVVPKAQAIEASLKLLDAAAESAGGWLRDSLSAEKASAEGLKGQINDTQAAIGKLAAEIGKLREIKIEIKANDGDAGRLESIIKRLQEMAAKEFAATMNIDTSKAEALIAATKAKASEPTQSTHTVQPDTSAAQQAINNLRVPTSSIHTVYVRQVEQRAGGGPIFRRRTGAIRGPGSSTSDSIPAMLSVSGRAGGSPAIKRSAGSGPEGGSTASLGPG
jgi:hypothetical protein